MWGAVRDLPASEQQKGKMLQSCGGVNAVNGFQLTRYNSVSLAGTGRNNTQAEEARLRCHRRRRSFAFIFTVDRCYCNMSAIYNHTTLE